MGLCRLAMQDSSFDNITPRIQNFRTIANPKIRIRRLVGFRIQRALDSFAQVKHKLLPCHAMPCPSLSRGAYGPKPEARHPKKDKNPEP